MKKIEFCKNGNHDWYKVAKCKDVKGNHPCIYHPEGCDTCLTKFECYTKSGDEYCSRVSAIFYACYNCPAVKMEGTRSEWTTHEISEIIDIRKRRFKAMPLDVNKELTDRWEGR